MGNFTIKDSPVTFQSPAASAVNSVKAYFNPVQSGTGTPGPDNIRAITGWTGLTVNANDTVLTADWSSTPGTIYGGSINLMSGALSQDYQKITLGQDMSPRVNGRSSTGGYANSTVTGKNGCKFVYFEIGWPTEQFLQYSMHPNKRNDMMFDCRNLRTDVDVWGSTQANTMPLGDVAVVIGASNDYEGIPLWYCYLSVPSDCADLAAKREYLGEHPVEMYIPVTHPKSYSITLPAQSLQTNIGSNTFSSNANGDVEVNYDVVDSKEMLEIRRRIIMAQPGLSVNTN